MALGTTAALGVGLGASALGSLMNRRSQRQAVGQQNAYGSQMADYIRGLMQSGPSGLEQSGMGMLGQGGFDINTLLGGGFNTGQDALMQMLRTDPTARSGQTLEGIIAGGGNPFDTSGLFGALGTLDQRALDRSAAALHAGAPGLGQRFGSAMRGSEVELRRQALEDASARNAAIQMQSHGDAQGRLLQATGMLQQGDLAAGGLQAQIAQMLQQGGLGAAGLGVQAQGQQGQLLGMLLNAEQNRMGRNAGLAGMQYQMGMPQGMPGYGDIIGQIGAAVPGFMTNRMLLNNPEIWRGRV